MEIFVSQIMTGLSIGSILLLVALGLAIIYGVTGVINLAHGEFVMLGAYAAWFLQTQFGLGLLASLVPIFLLLALAAAPFVDLLTMGWLTTLIVLAVCVWEWRATRSRPQTRSTSPPAPRSRKRSRNRTS